LAAQSVAQQYPPAIASAAQPARAGPSAVTAAGGGAQSILLSGIGQVGSAKWDRRDSGCDNLRG
jgi:hypothetical protein